MREEFFQEGRCGEEIEIDDGIIPESTEEKEGMPSMPSRGNDIIPSIPGIRDAPAMSSACVRGALPRGSWWLPVRILKGFLVLQGQVRAVYRTYIPHVLCTE